jgi:(p)ppGpp synthase/HD superfamily hydrolase
MATIQEVESYARMKNADLAFCNGIVFRLKSIGVSHEDILCSAILCQTKAGFDEIYSRFGREIATMVASISKDNTLPKQRQEEQYAEQLQSAPWESILIKLCEISANFKMIKETEMSKTKRRKLLKQNIHYLNVLKKKISDNKSTTPGVERLLEGVNETLTYFSQRSIKF